MNKPFVPLHVHSEYSALDGASKVKDIIKKAAYSGMPAMAITDHGVMNSMVSFYKGARKAGIKPIVGCEIYVSPRSRLDKIKLGDGEKNAHHLVLLATNKTGVKNLNIICSKAHLEGYYYKPRADKELLAEYSEGLIALTACLGGSVPQAILRGDYSKATEEALWLNETFKDRFYLEMQDHGDPQQQGVNKHLIQMSHDLGIPLVATNDSHFTNREDKAIHDIILAISTGSTKSSPGKLFYTPEHYFKTPEEMWDIEIFKANPESLINTVRIADQCNYVMELGMNQLPDYPVPDGHTQDSYLEELVYKGLERRYEVVTEEILHRARYELSIVTGMGFSGYLLIVWDFIDWAKRNGIETGLGRGSAAGSIICYATGITGVDPLYHGLLFERFLNPDRISMPDIDVDFCIERRQEVMNYVAEKYGDDRVCQIITFGTMGAKQAFKDVARVLELPYGDSDRLSKLIPKDVGMTIADALKVEDFRMAIEGNLLAKEVVDLAQRLEGNIRNTSTHAAGVIISKYPVMEICPLMQVKEKKAKKGDTEEDHGVKLSSQTQLEQADAEALGLIKMDFLGLRNLTMIRKSIEMIDKNYGIKIDLDSKEMKRMDDKKVYDLISSGKTLGLFQLESDGITKLVIKMRPSFFGDLSALIALYRPGPLSSSMDEIYVQCKHGQREVTYAHPDLEPILKDTYGTMIYQEQIMKIAQVMAGYTLGEADFLRKAMGKKKPEEMEKQRSRFMSGAAEKGYDLDLAEGTFDKMAKFAEYGFNMAHSVSYGAISYFTAFLKTYYPAEFMASFMSSHAGDNAKIMIAVRECGYLGIKVLPPDVNFSQREFTVINGDIRFGMLSIKGVGENFIESIIDNRSSGLYVDLVDFCKRVAYKTFNAGTLQSLIKSGAFDLINRNRALLIDNIPDILAISSKDQKSSAVGQRSLFGDLAPIPVAPMRSDVLPFDMMTELEYERELMGIYVSGHPLKALPFNHEFHYSHEAVQIEPIDKGPQVVMCGILRSIKKIVTKSKGQLMAFLQIEDLSGVVSAVLFPGSYIDNELLVNENALVQIFGTMGRDRDGEPQVMINKLKPLQDQRSVLIRIDSLIDSSKLVTLQKVMQQFKGDTPVVFKFSESDDLVVANYSAWINYSSDFVDRIESVLGPDTVDLI